MRLLRFRGGRGGPTLDPEHEATIEQRMSVRTVLGLIRRSIGSFDPAYLPRFARRLDPPPGRCLLAVKGWFAHGRGSMQRDPWVAVEVWCDGKLVGVLSQGLGRAGQLVAPLAVGAHLVKFVGFGAKLDTGTLLREFRVGCRERNIHYIAFVPPRPNPIARKPKPRARWFYSSWVPGRE